MNRREQKEQTRRRILEAALDCFLERGFYGTKTSQISKRAGVSEGLLFYHFPTKENLLEELIRVGMEGMRTPMQITAPTGLGHFEAFSRMLFSVAKQNPFIAKMFVFMAYLQRAEDVSERLRQMAASVDTIDFSRQWVEQGQQDGSIRDGDPLALSNMYWCSVHGIMEQFAARPDIPLPEPKWIIDMLRVKEGSDMHV